jgi:hypothetical protein
MKNTRGVVSKIAAPLVCFYNMKQYEDKERYADPPSYREDNSLNNLEEWEFMTDREEDENNMRGLWEGLLLRPKRPEGIVINEM